MAVGLVMIASGGVGLAGSGDGARTYRMTVFSHDTNSKHSTAHGQYQIVITASSTGHLSHLFQASSDPKQRPQWWELNSDPLHEARGLLEAMKFAGPKRAGGLRRARKAGTSGEAPARRLRNIKSKTQQQTG